MFGFSRSLLSHPSSQLLPPLLTGTVDPAWRMLLIAGSLPWQPETSPKSAASSFRGSGASQVCLWHWDGTQVARGDALGAVWGRRGIPLVFSGGKCLCSPSAPPVSHVCVCAWYLSSHLLGHTWPCQGWNFCWRGSWSSLAPRVPAEEQDSPCRRALLPGARGAARCCCLFL